MGRIVLSAVAIAAVALAGCGGNGTNSATPVAADPLTCLDAAGLTNVEERGSNLWRGNHEGPFYLVIIARDATAKAASDLVIDAVESYAASAGRYVVTGPAKPAAGGLLSADEADEAGRIVEQVAACLKG